MKQLKPLTWRNYLLQCGVTTLLNYVACRLAIPYFELNSSLPIEIIYFISVGGIALAPMFFGALYLTKTEINAQNWAEILERMRVKRLSKSDWVWTISAFVLLCVASFLIAKVIMPEMGLTATPFFFKNMPLDGHHMWILYVWPVFFFFNIFGEEFFWRGYIQPRQELLHKKWTWFFHGIFWAIWHLPMGLDLVFASLPIFFILPAIVQLRANTSIAIVVHAVFGAFGFWALAFAALH